MTKFLTKNIGTNLRLSNKYGMNLSFTPRRRGHVSSNKSRLVVFRRWPCFKASTKLGTLEMFFVGGIINILSEMGRDKLDRWSSLPVGVVMVVWGWSLAWEFSGLSLVKVYCLFLFMWQYLAPEGPRLPSVRTRYVLGFNSSWRSVCWPSVSKKTIKK